MVCTQEDREQLLYGLGYGGLPADRFRAISIHCIICDKIMTARCPGKSCMVVFVCAEALRDADILKLI